MRRGVVIVACGLLLLAAAGCGSSSSSSSGGTTTEASGSGGGGGQKTIAGVNANDHGTKAVADKGKTEVELDDFYFKPTVLEGKPGQKVTLELRNEGQIEHSFTIDSQGIDKDIQPGDEAEVTVTIPKSGVRLVLLQVPQELRDGRRARRHRPDRRHRRDDHDTRPRTAAVAEAAVTSDR